MESTLRSRSARQAEFDLAGLAPPRPSVCIVFPAFNEEAILEANVREIVDYLEALEERFEWNVILVNDGSSDATGPIADALANEDPRIVVAHHPSNMGLCQALKTGIALSNGDYVVTMDIDLSYSPDHIGCMLDKIVESGAKIVLASPYMEGGKVSNVPCGRAFTSRWANRFLRFVAPERISTFTGMVRAFEGRFIRSLDLKAKGMDVNPEIVYKAMILRAKIAEVPAHLHWRDEEDDDGYTRRKSSMAVPWNTLAILFTGFVFRPFLFFLIPGAILMMLSLYTVAYIFIHIADFYQRIGSKGGWFLDRLSASIEFAYEDFPHTFFVGGIGTVISIQLLSLGFMSMQNKRYFEESYHLLTTIYKKGQKPIA